MIATLSGTFGDDVPGKLIDHWRITAFFVSASKIVKVLNTTQTDKYSFSRVVLKSDSDPPALESIDAEIATEYCTFKQLLEVGR
jgi:hypothetical protein